MRSFRNLPIKWKLMLVMIFAGIIVVALLSSVLFYTGLVRLRHLAVGETAGLAAIIGGECAGPLAARDANAAQKKLGDLAARTTIEEACLYTADGREFARYTRHDLTPRPSPPARESGECFAGDHLELYRQIEHGGKPAGMIRLRTDTHTQWAQIKSFVGASVVATAILAFAMLALASWLERFLFSSIRELVRVARGVTERKDFTLRAAKLSEDETGTLTEAFNQMLGIIQKRDSDSRASQNRLEKGVQERTRQLEDSNARLKTEMTGRTQAERALAQLNTELEARVQRRTAALIVENTERKRAEEKVKTERQRFYDVLETLPAYVVLLMPDYHVAFANRFFRERFGESHGRRCYEYLFHRTEPCETCESYTVLKTRAPHHWEWAGPDGCNYDIHDFLFTDTDGSPLILEMGIDITARRQIQEELRASQGQLRVLTAHLQAAREEERTRVAREIHDVLAQELTRLKMGLAWLRRSLSEPNKAATPETLAVRISEMSQMTDAAIRCVQEIATELRPAVLDSLGLCAAVEWQARDFCDDAGIQCHVSMPEQEFTVDREAATAAFRILQESLTNVQRHAQATRVDVLLRQEAGQLILRVKDNGCGVRSEALTSAQSIGLVGMRERAMLLGGQFKIWSQPGSGTTIEVRLPLSKQESLPEGNS